MKGCTNEEIKTNLDDEPQGYILVKGILQLLKGGLMRVVEFRTLDVSHHSEHLDEQVVTAPVGLEQV